VVLRPGDANEVNEAWKIAIERRNAPTALILTRQNLPTLDRQVYTPAKGLRKGAYVLADLGESDPDLILMASGSEVSLIVEAASRLSDLGKNVRIVSFPSWELFEAQDINYQDSVLPPKVRSRLAVEAGVSLGWERWVGRDGKIIGVDRYGASAPFKVIYEQYGLTVNKIVSQAKRLID
jgi:transketolase